MSLRRTRLFVFVKSMVITSMIVIIVLFLTIGILIADYNTSSAVGYTSALSVTEYDDQKITFSLYGNDYYLDFRPVKHYINMAKNSSFVLSAESRLFLLLSKIESDILKTLW